MNIKIKVAVIILGLSIFYSCSDWMDLIPPEGLIREEFWKTKEDVDAVMMGAYDTFAKLDRKLFLYGELRGDMVTPGGKLGSDESQISKSSIYPDNSLCNWEDFYQVINFCNEVIKNAPEVQKIDNTFTEFQMYRYLSEAVYLRSLTYFYLVRIWKDVPYITVPTETDDSELYYPKSTDDEILSNILADLEEYRTYATTEYQTLEEQKGRVTKSAFDALLADIYLWTFDYEKVLQYVGNIEANQEIEMLGQQDLFTLYFPGNSLESIFEIQYDTKRSQNNGTYGLTNYNDDQIDPSDKAIDMFSIETGLEVIRGEGFSIRKEGTDDYIIWKYVGMAPDGESARPSSEQYSANFIIYRLADVMMMKAEALSQLGRYGEARDVFNGGGSYRYFNTITERSGYAFSAANSPAAFEDAILDQRARELAFEGKRWFDLMRMGRRNNYDRKSKFIDIVVANVPSTQKRILRTKLTDPMGWYLPIYEDELQRNKNLVQNPYYNF